ncbi:MAG: heat-inducible transcription repressor HrcA [Ruminococcaceae bacterium]|nr:heat-inducible transcription repressor HrcA [Oscillospiraceae bacterium]
MLGERREAILGMIIDYYIKTGEPLGSKTLCSMLPYTISSATIRNEMAFLTGIGFLEQRHTSGGRVPTKAAYRYYVDNIVKLYPLSGYEMQKINEVLSINASDPERLLASAGELLSEQTGCAAFFSTLKDPYDCIQGIELIPAGNNKAMLVMLSLGGKIKSSVCTVNCPIDDEFKELFYSITKQFFIGTPLVDIDLSFIQSTAPFLGARIFDMLPILSSLCSLCSEATNGVLSISGETKLLSQAELGNSIYKLLVLLAQKDKLEELLSEFAKAKAPSVLLIGDENPVYELRNTVMAVQKFKYNNNQTATLGIIGSLRIDYESVLSRVDYIMKTVESYLTQGGVRYE